MTDDAEGEALGEFEATDFEDATIDEIAVGREPADAVGAVGTANDAAAKARAAIDAAKLDRMQGDTKRMGHLFWFVVGLVAAVVIGVYGVFIAYICSEWGRVPSSAIIALIGGTVVEVIGILAVITKYLYRVEKDEAARAGK